MLVSYWGGLFSGAMAVSFLEGNQIENVKKPMFSPPKASRSHAKWAQLQVDHGVTWGPEKKRPKINGELRLFHPYMWSYRGYNML